MELEKAYTFSYKSEKEVYMANLVRFDPFAELDALHKQFFGDDFFTRQSGLRLPTTDVYVEDGKQLNVEAHLPHFKDEDVNVHVDNGSLVIQAEKHEQEKDKKKKYVVRESSSSFYRRVHLPEQADVDKIEAEMKE
jgi:HSP20 family protein